MAVNGTSPHNDADTIAIASTHLGKRKRSVSADALSTSEKEHDPVLQNNLQNVLQLLRKHDTQPSLLKHPLSTYSSDSPSSKRTRLLHAETTNDTIEHRILAESYTSIDSLKDDVNSASRAILEKSSQSTVNGLTPSLTLPPESNLKERLSSFANLLADFAKESSKITNGDTLGVSKKETVDLIQLGPRTGHVLSLRTQTNGQTQLLYSGLQSQRQSSDGAESESEEVTLPNGFELTDFAVLNGGIKPTKQTPQTLGVSFGPPKNGRWKILEEPRVPKNPTRLHNKLEFVSSSVMGEHKPHNKPDYKYARLPTGSWISYGAGNTRGLSQAGLNDFRSTLIPNEIVSPSAPADDTLFTSVYSSFAPTSDNSAAIISSEDRGQHWWRKHGERKLPTFFAAYDAEESSTTTDTTKEFDNFDHIIANWESGDDIEPGEGGEDEKDVNNVLQEVSELLETLSSYQRNRGLDPSGRMPDPSKSEFDTFEILRSQLSILVTSLPPFAVAKLNGEQLEELNISTRILTETPNVAGTGQEDEHALKLKQASFAATSAAISRPVASSQVRPGHSQVGTNTSAHNVQARNYNASVPATAAYGMRATTNYQTPSAARPAYSQTPYRSQATPYTNRPTIQQFQRQQMQNGYGSYGGTPAQTQSPGFTPGANHVAYQQRAQNSASVTGSQSTSPQKPLVNGQALTPRQHSQATPYPYQRPASGTPGTPNYASAGTGAVPLRYDGASDPKNGEVNGSSAAHVAGPVQPQTAAGVTTGIAVNPSQTVEVSR